MRFFDRIRPRTVAYFCLAGGLPLLLLGLLLHTRVTRTLSDGARALDQSRARALLADVENRLDFHGEQFASLATAPPIQTLDARRQASMLRPFLGYNPVFFKIMTFDGKGTLLNVVWRNRYRGEENRIGTGLDELDPLLAEALRKALSTGRVVHSRPTVDQFSQPVLYFVTPVFHFVHSDRVIGAVAAGLQLYGHQIQDVLDRAELPADAHASIVDGRGQILARRGGLLPESMDVLPDELRGKKGGVDVLAPEGGMRSRRLRLAGREVLLTSAPLPSVGLFLVVARPWDNVMAPARKAVEDGLLVLAAGLCVSLLVGLGLSASLLRPLTRLVNGIRTVAEGRLSHRIPVERDDELGQAARAFNDMASELEKQELIDRIWTETWKDA